MSPITTSFVVPAYNAARTLDETLQGIADQTHDRFECLVVNDGSTDTTKQIIQGWCSKDARFKLIDFPVNKKLSAARNAGLDAATGQFIALCDADDIPLPTRLEKQLEYLEQNPGVVACGTAVEFFGEMDCVIYPETDPDLIEMKMLFTNEMFITSVTARKDFIDRHHIRFVEENPETVEDWLFYRDVLRAGGKIANLADVLTRYRRSPGQLSANLRDTATCRAALVRADLLEMIGITQSEMDLATHVAVSPCYWPLLRDVPEEAFSRGRVTNWLGKLSAANWRSKRFQPDAFDRLLDDVMDDFNSRQHNGL